MTIKKLLAEYYLAYPQLGAGDIDLVLGISLHRSPEYLYKNSEKKLTSDQVKAFKKLFSRHLAGWSIAHLAGVKYFFGLKFLVNKHTLIPRPESELLVTTALDYLAKNKIKSPNVIDIGTGSGCLILSLAKNFYAKPVGLASANPTGWFIGTDISKFALKTASTNARKLGLKKQINFVRSNLFKNIKPQKFNIILANLPYLTKIQLKEASIKKEPHHALYGGKDGLEYYTKLLTQIAKYLDKKYLILLEIDPKQTLAIKDIIKKYLPNAQVNILTDLAEQDRIVAIQNN